jgi:hypothetical protein
VGINVPSSLAKINGMALEPLVETGCPLVVKKAVLVLFLLKVNCGKAGLFAP